MALWHGEPSYLMVLIFIFMKHVLLRGSQIVHTQCGSAWQLSKTFRAEYMCCDVVWMLLVVGMHAQCTLSHGECVLHSYAVSNLDVCYFNKARGQT